MTAKEIIGYIVLNNLWRPPKGGVSPVDTLAERLNSDIKRGMSFFKKSNGKFLNFRVERDSARFRVPEGVFVFGSAAKAVGFRRADAL